MKQRDLEQLSPHRPGRRAQTSPVARAAEVFTAFLRLGVTSFGGPVAHLGYFRNEFVARRRWLDEETYAYIVALCQLMPGPASTQVGIIVGYERAGALGAFFAWCGFALPSAIVLVAFSYGLQWIPDASTSGWVHGLLVAAVAVVALAVSNMATMLAPDVRRRAMAAGAAIGSLLLPNTGYTQLVLIGLGAVLGWTLLQGGGAGRRLKQEASSQDIGYGNPRFSLACAVAFLVSIVGFSVGMRLLSGPLLVFGKFFVVGGLVFGGGHVVLPLLQSQVVPPGWISNTHFLAGYGAAQAIPGPLFTFAAYLGAAMQHAPVHGVPGAALCLIAIFAPSFLLIGAVLPVWKGLIANPAVEACLRGVNATVVGILAAALYNPVWLTAIRSASDVAVMLAALAALALWKAPPWSVVVGSALVCGVLPH